MRERRETLLEDPADRTFRVVVCLGAVALVLCWGALALMTVGVL